MALASTGKQLEARCFFQQLEREHGSHYTKEYEISVGMKYQF